MAVKAGHSGSIKKHVWKGLRKILRVSWIAKKTNEWVLNKAAVKRELSDTVKARKLAYYGHTMRKLECWPMPNVMAAQPNIGGTLCESSVINNNNNSGFI